MQEPEKYSSPHLVREISVLMEESKQQVVKAANSLVSLSFSIASHIMYKNKFLFF